MSVYLVSYDLRKADFDYQPLWDELAKMEAQRVQASVWGVHAEDPEEIFERLWARMHPAKDRLFVVPFDKSARFKELNPITELKSI